MSEIPDRTRDRAPEIDKSRRHRPFLTIVTPAYNEAESLPVLYQHLRNVLDKIDIDWEWIVVDDHSNDDTPIILTHLVHQESRLRGFRFSRNNGSHTAITCGLKHASGDCAVILAADLQDPPETLPILLKEWENGVQVVWAVRARREGEKASTIGFAWLYYSLMRHVVGIREMPTTGADFFLIDRVVIDAFCQFNESHASILALITWMGFKQSTVEYDKKARLHGRSGWSFGKKLKLAVDSITSFSYLPIRLISYTGFIISMIGFIYAGIVILNYLVGNRIEGWSSLMVVLLVIGGFQMLMMGVLGEYLWRTFDESRRRPRYFIEDAYGVEKIEKRERGVSSYPQGDRCD